MKIQFQIRGLNANAGLRAWLEKQLELRHKNHRQHPLTAARWSGTPSAARA
jgi:hypothetical protein